MPGIDECLLEAMRLPGARGASVVDWTSGLALGTVGDSPGGDHETTAAEAAELARLAAEHRAFAPEDDAGWSGEACPVEDLIIANRAATTCCGSSRPPSTAASSCTSGWPARRATSPSPASGSARWPDGWCWDDDGQDAHAAPLPVRRRTEIPSVGVSPMLSRLAAERATGVLMREGGMLHLLEGQVVYAESHATPGLDVLLVARGALDEEGWREAVAEAGRTGWSAGSWSTAAGSDRGHWNCAIWAHCTTRRTSSSVRAARPPASGTGTAIGSALSARFRWPRWNARPFAAGSCCTAYGPIRRRTGLRSSAAPPGGPGRHVPPGNGARPDRRRADGDRHLTRAGPSRLPHAGRRTAAGRRGCVAARPAAPAPRAETLVPTAQPAPFADPHITLLKRLRDALEAL